MNKGKKEVDYVSVENDKYTHIHFRSKHKNFVSEIVFSINTNKEKVLEMIQAEEFELFLLNNIEPVSFANHSNLEFPKSQQNKECAYFKNAYSLFSKEKAELIRDSFNTKDSFSVDFWEILQNEYTQFSIDVLATRDKALKHFEQIIIIPGEESIDSVWS